MSKKDRSGFKDHPFHLVDPSPWPLFTCASLLGLTSNTSLSMHNFSNSHYLVYLSLLVLVASMSFWFRDIITEGKKKYQYILYYLKLLTQSARKFDSLEIEEALNDYKNNNDTTNFSSKNNLSYYLAGLLEGDGSISLPSLGVTSLNRVLNPRIVFTSHIINIGMYAFLQSELGNIGRFQKTGENGFRYIIGDKESIIFLINLMHGKLRTPKNKRFNDLIDFINNKYNLNISESSLDNYDFADNMWFTGFCEADGHFGIKYIESKPKSETRKRSVSESVSLKFRLDQRLFDKSTSTSMEPFMKSLALFLNSNLKTYASNNSKVLSISVESINKIDFIINYFNKYPLIGNKLNDFKNFKIVYNIMISKEHLTQDGKLKIKNIINKI